MDRRGFIRLSGLAAGSAGVLAAPAVAQTRPAVEWRAASGFPASLPIPFGAAQLVAAALAEASDGRFTIVLDEEAEPLPHAEALESVRNGSVDMLHTAPHYFADINPAFAFGSGLPFGLNQRLTDAWLHEAGGLGLFNEFLSSYGLVGLPAGNTGAQTGGWFNREINALDDLDGLRFRIGGFGARIIAEIGVLPVEMAPEAISAALEADEIDAAEFAGPADDIRLGLHRAARYLYYPGWWEGGIALMALVNRESWNALPENYRAMLRHAATASNMRTMARYDVANANAFKELIDAGTIVRPYGHDIMDASFAASERVYDDIAAENPAFSAMLESYLAFRRTGYGWLRHADYAYDTYLIMAERGGRL